MIGEAMQVQTLSREINQEVSKVSQANKVNRDHCKINSDLLKTSSQMRAEIRNRGHNKSRGTGLIPTIILITEADLPKIRDNKFLFNP
jgi:hypothetical protein